MGEENISQEFRLKNIAEIRTFFVEEIEQNELMRKKHERVCAAINYIAQFLILVSAVLDVLSYAFASLIGVPTGIRSSVVGLKICALTAGITKYKSMIKKKRRGMIK